MNFSILFCLIFISTSSISAFDIGHLAAGIFDVLGPCPPTYKLTYFPIRGRAESIRMMLAACGQKYEDFRVNFADWPLVKSNYTFMQLPTLEIKQGDNIMVIAQSHAIMNFLAKECNLLPESSMEAAYADMFAQQYTDVLNAFSFIYNSQNLTDQVRAQLYAQFFSSIWSLTLNRTEERICLNGHGVIAGHRISYADIYLSTLLDLATVPGTNVTREQFTNSYPNIRQLDVRVRSIPSIARWLIIRPKTNY